MKKTKSLLIVVALLALTATSQAQLEVGLIVPDKKTEFGFIIKPSPVFALTLRSAFGSRLHAFESHWRWGLSIGYAPLLTSMDAFPIFRTNYTDGFISEQKKVYHIGEQRFKNNVVNLFYGAAMIECKILKTALSPIVGVEFRMNVESFSFSTYYPEYDGQFSEDSHSGASGSIFPKVGVVYDMDWWTFQLTAGYNKDFIYGNSDGFPYSAVSASVIYYFD